MAHIEWRGSQTWRELMFAECDQEALATQDPVAPATRFEAAMKKACRQTLDDGTPRCAEGHSAIDVGILYNASKTSV